MLPIPHYQPVPFPAPLWLLQTLLVLGFFLHVIPMNIALAGGFSSAALLITGKSKQNDYAMRLGKTLATALPIATSFAITQGIVPLLFLQLIYGPLYYTSSILMAEPWLLIIFLLIVGYYTAYIFGYSKKPLAQRNPWILITGSFLFMIIAYLFTSNMTLMLTPEKWAAMYQANPYGVALNVGEPQLLPRFLHFLVASFAVVGLLIGAIGLYWRNREEAYGTWLIKKGALVFLIPTVLQLPIGMWFMFSIPKPIMMNFMGGDPVGTALFGAGFLLSLVAIVAMAFATATGGKKSFTAGMHSSLVLILVMVVMRHMLRLYTVQPFIAPHEVPVKIQWDLLITFVLFAAALIGYLAWLVRLVWKAFHPVSEVSPNLSVAAGQK